MCELVARVTPESDRVERERERPCNKGGGARLLSELEGIHQFPLFLSTSYYYISYIYMLCV
ncbi:hypothetical protein Hanom_Chr09g00869171 [Helianthus anomalus]